MPPSHYCSKADADHGKTRRPSVNAIKAAPPVTASHILIHRSADKERFYEEARSLHWSDELECWTTSGRDAILQILKDKDFHVIDYGSKSLKLSERLKIDFLATQELLTSVPLGHEGAQHAALRKKMAIAIRDRSVEARLPHSRSARVPVSPPPLCPGRPSTSSRKSSSPVSEVLWLPSAA